MLVCVIVLCGHSCSCMCTLVQAANASSTHTCHHPLPALPAHAPQSSRRGGRRAVKKSVTKAKKDPLRPSTPRSFTIGNAIQVKHSKHCALWSTALTPALYILLSPPAPHAAQARPQPLRALASLRARAAPEEDPAGAPEGASLDQPVQACSGPQPGRRGVQAPCQVSLLGCCW